MKPNIQHIPIIETLQKMLSRVLLLFIRIHREILMQAISPEADTLQERCHLKFSDTEDNRNKLNTANI